MRTIPIRHVVIHHFELLQPLVKSKKKKIEAPVSDQSNEIDKSDRKAGHQRIIVDSMLARDIDHSCSSKAAELVREKTSRSCVASDTVVSVGTAQHGQTEGS